jgi:replicative DNA helicase
MSENTNPDQQSNRNLRSVTRRNEDLGHFVYGKLPPQATKLEEAILGAIMLDKNALPIVLDILQPTSFYKPSHQKIFRVMMSLFEKTQPIDMLTVEESLRKAGEIESVGGAYYLAELTSRVASAANIEFHARIVAQKHIQRELIRVSTETIKNAYEDGMDVFDLLDTTEKGLFDITQNNLSRSYESMNSLAAKVMKSLEELQNKEDGLTGVPTGFSEVDRLTSGLQKSDLIIIAARPGMGKCLGKGTKVVMYDGRLKKVEDIRVGDLLMGDDSTPRRVLSLARGREQMYWIRQNKGIDYRVNESHILSLKKSRQQGRGERGDVLNISVRDYLTRSNKFKTNYKGYRVAIELDEQHTTVEPYFLGIWLSDGSRTKVEVTNQDEEVVDYIYEYAKALDFRVRWDQPKDRTHKYSIVGGRPGHTGDSMKKMLREIGVLHHKHIPDNYLYNSTTKRLELLAGLIDSDGHYLVQSNGYGITQKREGLARQIKYLCDSLGFRTSLKSKKASIASIGYETTVWRLRIYGDIHRIPVRIVRKKANPWKSIVNWKVTGIQVEKDIVDDYYGFELDGNKLFLLEDMTVTHNTSYVLSLARNAAADFGKGVAIFSLEMSNVQLVTRIISLEAEVSGQKLRAGKLDNDEMLHLNSTIERLSDLPIFIDDTPGINIFELRAKCRRLKMQHDIQLVIIDYLQLMSGGGENSRGNREQEVSMISRSLKALAKELDVPVIALSQLSRAVEVRGGTKRPQLSDLRESGCLTGDAILINAQTGEQLTIQSLAERTEQTPIPVVAMDENRKLGSHILTRAFPSGTKEVFELKTSTGRRIKASANHPFRKLDQWVRLDELSVGDKIAAVEEVSVEKQSDIIWDEIISITSLGEEMVYDATVPSVSNFVANNIVVHNSIEQDADMVAFIYRPEYYQIMEDEEGQSLKGVAELIFAKNRHGATKTIKLKFIDQFAKFDDLDDFALDGFDVDDDSNSDANYGNIQILQSKMNSDEDIPF